MKAHLSWTKEMQFECHNRGLKTLIDSTPEHGGSGLAPTPKELILNAMMGCTAMDVVSILKKMRQQIDQFEMEIVAEKTSEFPIHFKSAEIIYKIFGDIAPEKAIAAIEASLTKYCGVNYMISKTCQISYRLILNNSEIKRGLTHFN